MPIKDLLDKLVSSELLTEETRTELKTELETALNEAIAAAKVEAKEETEKQVRLELTEEFVADKDALIEALDSKVTEALNSEFAELKDDIARFRDLDTEYTERFVEAKKEMAVTVKADMTTLVERLDSFLTERLTEEFTELREDINQVKKLEFGRKIFEAVASEYVEKYVDTDETATSLAKANEELKNTTKVLETVNQELAAVKRDQKMTVVLESLHGNPKEVMAVILKNVPTDKLEETYNKYIGRVLHESVNAKVEDTKSEKENGDPSVLAEGKDSKGSEADTKLVTGDTPVVENKEADIEVVKLDESTAKRLRELGGIVIE